MGWKHAMHARPPRMCTCQHNVSTNVSTMRSVLVGQMAVLKACTHSPMSFAEEKNTHSSRFTHLLSLHCRKPGHGHESGMPAQPSAARTNDIQKRMEGGEDGCVLFCYLFVGICLEHRYRGGVALGNKQKGVTATCTCRQHSKQRHRH